MMPRTVNEFNYHIRVADAVCKHIWNETIKNKSKVSKVLKNTKESIRQYTYPKAIQELKTVLPMLGLSYKEFCSFNKHNMLKERFSFGEKYIL